MGNLIFVIFSDGFNDVYGVCVYVRWRFFNGDYVINFILFKNCFVFFKKLLIDWIEFCGVVLNKRLKIIIIE